MKKILFKSIVKRPRRLLDPVTRREVWIHPDKEYVFDETYSQFTSILLPIKNVEKRDHEEKPDPLKPVFDENEKVFEVYFEESTELEDSSDFQEIESRAEFLPRRSRENAVEQINELAIEKSERNIKIGLSHLDDMSVEQLSEYIRKNTPFYCLPMYETGYKRYPTKDELISMARFGYTDSADRKTGKRNTKSHARRYLKLGVLRELLVNNNVSFLHSQSKGELFEIAWNAGLLTK